MMMVLLDLYVLFYLRWVDTQNLLIMIEKNMCFVIEDDSVLVKYKEIWNNNKELDIKFCSKPVCDEKYIRTKVKTSNGVISTIVWGNKTPKERIHYTCVPAICIDSVMKIHKKDYPQVCLEECKYEIKNKRWWNVFMLN